MPNPKHEKLTLAQLRETQVFIALTPKQKRAVQVFVETNGDRQASVLAAYKVKNARNAAILSSQVFASPAVVACLAAYFQDEPLESFKNDVRKAFINRKITVAQVRALELLAELNGWGSASLPKNSLHGRDAEPSTEEPLPPIENGAAPVFTVGMLVQERSPDGVLHTGKVTAVAVDGTPTIEEIK
jgi:hypothetical protein